MNNLVLIIYFFGILLLIAGFILLIKPALILDFIMDNAASTALYTSAIIIRLILGGMLIYLANHSKHPTLMLFIGGIAILAGLSFAIMGKQRFTAFLSWIMAQVKPWVRFGGLAAWLFGGYLIYAFA